MSRRSVAQDVIDRSYEAYRRLGTYEKAARELGINQSSVFLHVKRKMGGRPVEKPLAERAVSVEGKPHFTVTESVEGMEIDSAQPAIRTVEQAIQAAKIDLAIWEVVDTRISTQQVGMKLKSPAYVARTRPKRNADDPDMLVMQHEPRVLQLVHIKIRLKRKVSALVEGGVRQLARRFERFAQRYKPIKLRKSADEPHLLVPSLYDIHFGKLGHDAKAGETYNLNIADRCVEAAVEQTIRRVANFNIERILLVLGQDYYNFDNQLGTTAQGTPQTNCATYHETFARGHMAFVCAARRLAEVAPVHVMLVEGNHAPTMEWHLAYLLQAVYSKHPGFTFDIDPQQEFKSYEYGVTLLGSSHAEKVKRARLANLMPSLWPAAWARTTRREWLVGHWHTEEETHFNTVTTHDGILVRVLPSMSGHDRWHKKHGYIMGARGAMSLLYSRSQGFVGQFLSSAAA